MKDHTCGMYCSCWHFLGALLWIAAFACLLIAWVANSQGTPVFGVETSTWYANALILGVLAIPLKLKRRGHGAGCGCSSCEAPKKK